MTLIYRNKGTIFTASCLSVLACLAVQRYVLTGWSNEAVIIFQAGVFLSWLVTIAVLAFSILAHAGNIERKV